MGSLMCCIPEILRLLTERLWPMAKEVEIENSKVAICKPLPQELVTDILSRLPADSLYQCAKAYNDWNYFFSTHYFIHDLFLPRASPTIIVYRSSDVEYEQFYLDDFGGDVKKTPISINIKDDPLISRGLGLSFSCFGLLFFTDPYLKYAVVFNPVTGEKTYLLHDCKGHTDICGVYYHPIAKEFCVLLVSWCTTYSYVDFKLFRERGPSRSWNTLSSNLYLPVTQLPPVNLNGALHWMRLYRTPSCTHSIVVYSIAEEEFKLMPIPGIVSILNHDGKSRKKMQLFDLNGNLALCQIVDVFEIWELQDYTSWFWTKTHSIKVEVLNHTRIFNFVLGTQNGALIIYRIGKGIFSNHLQTNTTKNFIFDDLKGSTRAEVVCLHTNSLISFRAFQPSSERYQEWMLNTRGGAITQQEYAAVGAEILKMPNPYYFNKSSYSKARVRGRRC